jgi:hypothetical protein
MPDESQPVGVKCALTDDHQLVLLVKTVMPTLFGLVPYTFGIQLPAVDAAAFGREVIELADEAARALVQREAKG